MIDLGRSGVKPMLEDFGEIMILEKTAKYLKLGNLLFIRRQGKAKSLP